MKKQLHLNQQGAVSMLSVAIFSLLITVIATLYIRSSVAQQKSALDYDLGNRSLYASLVGFEDTKRAIKSGAISENKTECEASTGEVSAKLGIFYSCQLVSFSPSVLLVDNIPANSSYLVPVRPATPPVGSNSYVLRISWSPGWGATTRNDRRLLTESTGQAYPPLVRTQIIRTENTLSRDTMRSVSYFLNPSTQNPPDNTTLNFSADDWVLRGTAIRNVTCDNTNCTGLITLSNLDFSNRNLFLVIKPLYRQIGQLSIGISRNGTDLSLGGQVTIDITGSAGQNVFKRTRHAIASPSGFAPQAVEFPDYSIMSGDGICKQMSLTTLAAGFNQGCYPDVESN